MPSANHLPTTFFYKRPDSNAVFTEWNQGEFEDRRRKLFEARSFAAPSADAPEPESEALESMYSDGYAGVVGDTAAPGEFQRAIESDGGSLDGKAIADANGLTGSGEGQLVAPFVHVLRLIPGVWPGAAQQRGSCVAHNGKNAGVLLMVCDVVSGKPDEVTGRVEGIPFIDPIGIANGGLSTEIQYWWRGYDGDGWTCEANATVMKTKGALMPRNDYPDLGIDLRKYSGSLEGKYGRRSPPEEILKAGQLHLVRTATRIRTFEEIRDYLANGYGLSSCGGEGFSSSRDENGVSKRSGSWAHAMAYIGVDDRDVVKQKYSTRGLVLILNSWGRWNRGGSRILGTNLDIPPGAFWARWEDVKNRTVIAVAGANGFAARTLPPITTGLG